MVVHCVYGGLGPWRFAWHLSKRCKDVGSEALDIALSDVFLGPVGDDMDNESLLRGEDEAFVEKKISLTEMGFDDQAAVAWRSKTDQSSNVLGLQHTKQ